MGESARRKEQDELRVFVEFARAAALQVDPGSLESCHPPEPDIRFRSNGDLRYFELGRLLDQGLQRLRIEAIRNAPRMVAVDVRTVGLPERDVLRKKLGKQYDTQGASLELLLFFDAENALVAGGVPDGEFARHAEHVMRPLLTPLPSRIRRVWVFERYQSSILWKFPPEP